MTSLRSYLSKPMSSPRMQGYRWTLEAEDLPRWEQEDEEEEDEVESNEEDPHSAMSQDSEK